ncbi:MAG: queuosine precursor transporter [Leptospiraceae bacterium]|nr:queuosine precursor transporter [Leptospiraceae bacterium]
MNASPLDQNAPLNRSLQLYVFFAGIFMTVLVITNIIGTKLFVFMPDSFPQGFFGSPFVLTTGILTYPVTFWLTDIVSEIWGRRHANVMVYFGFFASILMLVILSAAKAVPPASIWTIPPDFAPFFNADYYITGTAGQISAVDSDAAQAAFEFTFFAPGILLFASMLAYLVAQLIDVYLFHFWREATNGRHLWLRNNGSTLVSQLVDTIIVSSIFLYFAFDMPFLADAPGGGSIVQIIITVYFFKMLMALADTPFIYLGVWLIQKFLNRLP